MHQGTAEFFDKDHKPAQGGLVEEPGQAEENKAAESPKQAEAGRASAPPDWLDLQALHQRRERIEQRIADFQAHRHSPQFSTPEEPIRRALRLLAQARIRPLAPSSGAGCLAVVVLPRTHHSISARS